MIHAPRPPRADAGRRLLSAVTSCAAGLIIYGSWLPFNFSLRWPAGGPTWRFGDFEDVLTNVLIYVPLGLLVSLRVVAGGGGVLRRAAWPAIIAAWCIILAEGGQLLIPQRHASYVDMIFNGLGTMIGVVLAPAVSRILCRVVVALRLGLALRPMHTMFWILTVLVIFAKLAPFDFALRPSDFRHSLAAARWSPFLPSADQATWSVEQLVEMAGSFFAFVVLGIFGCLGLREAGMRRLDSIINTLARLILLALAVEAVQIIIVSHTADAADAVAYVYGAVCGAILAITTMDRGPRSRSSTLPADAAEKMLLMVALVVQCGIIVGYALPPSHIAQPPSATPAVQLIPFYAHFQEPFAVAVGHIISSFMWYLTLAVIAAAIVLRRGGQYLLAVVLLVTVGMVALAETVQIFSVSRYADVTEVLLAIVASIVAVAALRWIQQQRLTVMTAPLDVF